MKANGNARRGALFSRSAAQNRAQILQAHKLPAILFTKAQKAVCSLCARNNSRACVSSALDAVHAVSRV